MPKDHTQLFFAKTKEFSQCRNQMRTASTDLSRTLLDFPSINLLEKNGEIDPIWRQKNFSGEIVTTFTELYEVAELVLDKFTQILEEIVQLAGLSASTLKISKLKTQMRANEKAKNEYSERSNGPPISWLFDIVRAAFVCEREEDLIKVCSLLTSPINDEYQIVRIKNRFLHPTPGGYRDLLFNIRLTNKSLHLDHICELQLHFRPLKELDESLSSHSLYEYFRVYFRGSAQSINERLTFLEKLVFVNQTDTMPEPPPQSLEPSSSLSSDSSQLGLLVKESLARGNVDEIGSLLILLDLMAELNYLVEMNTFRYEKSLDKFGPEHPTTLALRSDLGVTHFRLSNYSIAKSIFEELIEIRERVFGSEDPMLINDMYNLSVVQNLMGDYLMTKETVGKVLAWHERVSGSDHPDTLSALNCLGTLLCNIGDLEGSKYILQRQTACSLKIFGRDHAQYFTSLSNLGCTVRRLGNFTEAQDYFEQALEGRERVLGVDHPDTLDSMHNLATIHLDLGFYSQAKVLFDRIVNCKERVLGTSDPSYSLSLLCLGEVHFSLGHFIEAIQNFETALEGFENSYGPFHEKVFEALDRLIRCHYFQKDLRHFQKYVQIIHEKSQQLDSQTNDTTFSSVSYENITLDEENIIIFPNTLLIHKHEHSLMKLPYVYSKLGGYVCDHCLGKGIGWVYHCDECYYDVHPKCAMQNKRAN